MYTRAVVTPRVFGREAFAGPVLELEPLEPLEQLEQLEQQ
jgi:hypothetical protein